MRVMVTGATGFVGAHSVKALVEAGHDVTLLVRSPERIQQNLGPLGVETPDHVVGDMGDVGAVKEALDGCDAVLHAAAVVALGRSGADQVQVNPEGARVVLGTAVERGLDPIVHVSSVAALFTPGVERVHADLPPAEAHSAYGRSKAEAETYVRTLQADGAPVTITYPGGVIGPPAGDAWGEMAGAVIANLKSGLIPLREGGESIIDVRDLAAIHLALMEPGRGPRRYMCGGHLLWLPELAEVYRDVTGRRFPVLPLSGAVFRGVGKVMDALGRVVPIDTVFTAEAMGILTRWAPTDDALVEKDLGITLRDSRETFADTVRALHAAGRISARQAGKLAA